MPASTFAGPVDTLFAHRLYTFPAGCIGGCGIRARVSPSCRRVCAICCSPLPRAQGRIPPPPSGCAPSGLDDRVARYVAAWPPCAEGARNNAAFLHACQLVNDFGLAEGPALALLRAWNAANQPPLPEGELVSVVKSAAAHHRFTPGAKRDRPPAENKAPRKPGHRAKPSEIIVPQPVYTRLSDVQAKPVNWLWRYRIAYAMLSLLIGIEGLGKTFLGLYIAACVTTGRPWPDSEAADDAPRPRNVIILTSKDHLGYTIRLRFDNLGGDSARLFALKGVTSPAGDAFFDIVRHLPALKAMIEEVGNVGLILCDPLPAFLGPVDQNKNGEVRVALSGFSTLAEEYGCAVLGISHLSKDASKQAIHRTIGSVAFSAAAREGSQVSDQGHAP